MKKIILLLILVVISFLSCSDNLENTIVSSPIDTNMKMDSTLFTSKLIDGAVGGELLLDQTFVNDSGREIKIYAELEIPPGSYQGTLTISLLINTEDVSIQFFPEMDFASNVKLNLVFKGIDLKALGYSHTRSADFAYFADNGDIELIENDYSWVSICQKKISVKNAKFNHFSRYGWLR